MNQTQVDSLLEQARAAARAGEDTIAEAFFRRAAAIDPERPDIWLELSGVVRNLGDKQRCLERVLALDPANKEARTALAWIRKKAPELAEQPVSSTQPAATPREPEEGQTADAEPEEIVYCATHPDVETTLRCNRCGKPICPQCAVRTPVGFRCEECVREQRAVFYTAGTGDYAVAGLVALALSTAVGYVMTLVGWFFALFLGPLAGGLIGEAVFRATGRRRGQQMWLLAAVALVIGAILPAVGLPLLSGNIGYVLSFGWLVRVNWVYVVLGIGAAIARLR